MPFWSRFAEEETETQRREGACQGHAVGFVAELGFERNVARPSRRALWRAGVHGTGHTDLVATPPEPWLLCSQQSWGGPPPGHFRGSSAGTESFLVLRGHSCRPPRTPPPAPEELVSVPGEGPHVTARFGVVVSRGPGRGSQPGPGGLWAPGAGAWGSSGEDRQEPPRGRSHLRIPRALAESTALGCGFSSRGLRPPVVYTSLGRNLSSAWLAGFDGVGI